MPFLSSQCLRASVVRQGMMLSERISALWLRLKALVRRRELDRDLDDELQFHLAMREQKLREQGVSSEEAPYAARRQFGNVTRLKETSRELWGFRWLETFAQDLRYGMRQLKPEPRFHCRGGHHPGPRHRRQYGDLPVDEFGPPAHASGDESPGACRGKAHQRGTAG